MPVNKDAVLLFDTIVDMQIYTPPYPIDMRLDISLDMLAGKLIDMLIDNYLDISVGSHFDN